MELDRTEWDDMVRDRTGCTGTRKAGTVHATGEVTGRDGTGRKGTGSDGTARNVARLDEADWEVKKGRRGEARRDIAKEGPERDKA